MYRIRTTFTGMQGSPWLNTLFFLEGGGTAQQAVTATGAFWGAVDALMDSEVDWTTEEDVALVDHASGDISGLVTTTPATGTGGAVGDAVPAATQALVRWRTGVFPAGRERRGRTFIPALVEASNDNGRLLAASRTTIQTAAAALIADATSTLVVWTRPKPGPPPVLGTFSNVSVASTWTEFAVLRSRRD